MARYYMYKNVYMHKTTKTAQGMLLKILARARELANGSRSSVIDLYLDENMDFFVRSLHTRAAAPEALERYKRLTDDDLIYHLKKWRHTKDRTLSGLSHDLLNRVLFKKIDGDKRAEAYRLLKSKYKTAAKYYMVRLVQDRKETLIYESKDDPILLFKKGREVKELSESSVYIKSVTPKKILQTPPDYYVHREIADTLSLT